MREVYYDEKSHKESPSPDWGGSSSGSGGAGWGGGGGGGGGAGWGGGSDGNADSTSQRDEEKLRLTAGGQLMVDNTGKLILCRQLCSEVPPLVIYLKRDSDVEEDIEASHARCIQCNLVYTQLRPLLNEPDKNLTYALWPIDRSADKAHYKGSFPLPDPGELLTVNLMWQKGHHDINDLSQMKIIIFGIDSGWETISRSNWRSVATVRVDASRHITVNGLSAKLSGNNKK